MRNWDVYQIKPDYRKQNGPVFIAVSVLDRPNVKHPVGSNHVTDLIGTFDAVDENAAIRKALNL